MFCPETPVNPVEKRIQELASFQLGQRRRYVRAVRRKTVIPYRRYSWMLFEHPADTAPVDTVVLDVDLSQALQIDRRVAQTFRDALPLCAVADGVCSAITSTARFGF